MSQHSTSDVWQKLDTQAGQILQLHAAQAASDQRLMSLEKTVDDGFRDINSGIKSLSERVVRDKPPVPWIGIGMLLLALMGVFGTYTWLITQPTQVMISNLNTESAKLRASLEQIKQEQNTEHKDIAYELGRLSAQTSRNSQAIDNVDHYGSRKWNSEGEPRGD